MTMHYVFRVNVCSQGIGNRSSFEQLVILFMSERHESSKTSMGKAGTIRINSARPMEPDAINQPL